jgi:ankyrin repeat protein
LRRPSSVLVDWLLSDARLKTSLIDNVLILNKASRMLTIRTTCLTLLFLLIAMPGAWADDLSEKAIHSVKTADLATLRDLLTQGVGVDTRDDAGSTLLMLAAGRGHTKVARFLVEQGADIHTLDGQMGVTPLHRAAQSGDVVLLKLFLQGGAFIDDQSAVNGHTPLLDAAFYKRYEAFAFLLKNDANLELRNTLGLSVKDWAVRQKDATLLQLIEDQEEVDSARIEQQKLVAAVREANLTEVQSILVGDPSYDVNEVAKDGMTPLLLACRNGHPEIARALLERGANPNLKDRLMKATPGHKAAFFGRAKILNMLCQAGLDLDAQGPYNGYTALHDAVLNSHIEAARVLVEAGASSTVEGLDGKTPRGLAEELGIVKQIWVK